MRRRLRGGSSSLSVVLVFMVSEGKSFIFHYRYSLVISKRDVSGSVLEAAPVSVSYIVVGSENGPFAFKAPDCLLLCAAERLTPSGQWTLQRHHSILESGEVQRGVKERSFPEEVFFQAHHRFVVVSVHQKPLCCVPVALEMRPSTQLLLPASLAVLLCLLASLPAPASGCNKALCASDVSKCLIQELCQCRPTDGNCSCCKECMLCLGTLWEECCDCVGMCNPKNYSDSPATSKSTVEELHRPIPSLFRALTEGEAPINMMVVSFPVAEELSHHENLVSFLETLEDQHQNVSLPGNSIHASYDTQDNMCTVVYFDDCVSIRQCKLYCESMGGSKYRWFHNACCQCIGPECVDYGSKAVKCMNCLF
ncbi:unnamed protein product [Boreogadus saida]